MLVQSDARALQAPRHAEEQELFAVAAARGWGAAFDDLYRRYEGRLYGLGRRLLGDDGLAEELVQETFVRLWRSADRFDPARGTVQGLVFTIARRVAVDLWRRPSSRPLDDGDGERAVAADTDDKLLIGLVVRDALASLSHAQREVLELFFDHDLEQRAIAARLDIPLGTVKTRTFYGLRALRDALVERGVGD